MALAFKMFTSLGLTTLIIKDGKPVQKRNRCFTENLAIYFE